MNRGEVWWTLLPPPWHRRPVVLLSRDEAYGRLTWIIAAPLTTRLRAVPTAVRVTPDEDGVPEVSVVTLDNMHAVRVTWVESFITRLSDERMAAVERAARFALGMRA